jgi:L-alanine-DL-glutamate epimerase-like enolase superfamily enzyme
MQIRRVTVYKADIPLIKRFRIALGTTDTADNIIVKIETDSDIYGIGEASPFTPIVGETQRSALAIARDLAKLLIGQDPYDIEGALQVLTRFT